MKKPERTVLPVLVALALLWGCRAKDMGTITVNVGIRNSSSNSLDWVEMMWKGPDISSGILTTGVEKTVLDAEWSFPTNATLTFVDKITRKPYSIEVPVNRANEQIRSGKCHDVVIEVLSYSNVEVICR